MLKIIHLCLKIKKIDTCHIYNKKKEKRKNVQKMGRKIKIDIFENKGFLDIH